MLNKMALPNFDSVTSGKNYRGRGPRGPRFFWSLKKCTKTFNVRLNESSCNILGSLGRYGHPEKKRKQKNK